MKVLPATPERWKDVEAVLGPNGAYAGCWCMYFLMPQKQWDKARGARAKAMLKKRVQAGPPPGVIAYDEQGEPVGWLQITPRKTVTTFNNPRRASAPLPDAPAEDESVWAASCFFVRPGRRGKGVTSALLAGAIDFARRNGARAIEACPIDAKPKMAAASLYVGATGVFARAGFAEAARRRDNRPLMRLTLAPAPRRAGPGRKR